MCGKNFVRVSWKALYSTNHSIKHWTVLFISSSRVLHIRVAAWNFFADAGRPVIKRCNPGLTAYVALNKITRQNGGRRKRKTESGTGSTSVLIKNYRNGGKAKSRTILGASSIGGTPIFLFFHMFSAIFPCSFLLVFSYEKRERRSRGAWHVD